MCAGLLLQLRESIRVEDRAVTAQQMETLPIHRAVVLFEMVMFDAACQVQVKPRASSTVNNLICLHAVQYISL
jgi:hypothetical protein